ncbi:MAG: hypothetical protein EOO89_18035 [Pedobacter sp.]|nr:MAG: hypothetical protein EOO89_18035 [Pedobacter sp.]
MPSSTLLTQASSQKSGPIRNQDQKERRMPEKKTDAASTLVVGAGELGMAVINGLLDQDLKNY